MAMYRSTILDTSIPRFGLSAIYDTHSSLKPNTRIKSSWASGCGEEVQDESYTATDFIPVTPGETVIWIKTANNEYACGYNINKEGIFDNGAGAQSISRRYRDYPAVTMFSIPDDMYYIRFSHTNSYMADPAFNFYRISTSGLTNSYNLQPIYDNLLDLKPNTVITGDWSGGAGTASYDASYTATNFMPVTPGETLHWISYGASEYACGYDENKDPIAQKGLADMCKNTVYSQYTVPEGMHYIRFSAANEYMTSLLTNFYRLNNPSS